MTLPSEYFDAMYDDAADPWGFQHRWYEHRKRELTTAMLPHRRYARGFEPGCSIGLLTECLATRCDRLLASDVSATAVDRARRQLAERTNVRIEQLQLPDEWPDGEIFELIVLSEVGYYLDASDLSRVLDLAIGSLAPGGVLMACHWRHEVADYPQSGDAVHEAIAERDLLDRAARHEERDFVLEVFTRGPAPSVAEREGLVP